MDWWHIARVPAGAEHAGVHARQLDPLPLIAEAERRVADDPELLLEDALSEVLGERAAAHRDELGFPPNGRWVTRPGWDSALSQGTPHPTLLAVATQTREE